MSEKVRLRSLEEGVAEVWYAFSDRPEEATEARRQLGLLSPEERKRHDRRRGEAARREFRTAHALVRSVLSKYRAVDPREWRFEFGEHGRPEIINAIGGPALCFNLSHTQGLVACVVALEAKVGIDVESCARQRSITKIARRMFSQDEQLDLQHRAGEDRHGRFLDYWTLKEAHLKALGAGMLLPMRAIRFELAEDGRARVSFEEGIESSGERWHYWRTRPSSCHYLAVAMAWSGAPQLRMMAHRP